MKTSTESGAPTDIDQGLISVPDSMQDATTAVGQPSRGSTDEETPMVVTMLEAHVAADRHDDFVREFNSAGADLPPAIVEGFLLHADGTDLWRIVTVWRSSEDLASYRTSVETPAGVLMFRAVGAEPTLTIFGVAGHLSH